MTTHVDTVKKAIGKMILHHPFYAAITLMSPVVPTDDVPTAGTDGDKIYYNPDFMSSLKPDEVVFVMAHEVEHIVRLHCHRVGGRDETKWNHAADHGINLDLLEQGLAGPKTPDGKFMGLADDQYKDMSAERVYNLLPDPPEQQGGGQGQPDGDGDGDGEPGSGGGTPNIFEGDVMPAKGKDGTQPSAAEQAAHEREIRGRIIQAAAQVKAAKGRGAIPAHLRHMIDELIEAAIDWRHELREFMTARSFRDYDWSRINRRMLHRGMRLPSLHSTHVGPMAVMIDTSGSCWSEIPAFLSEVQGIAADARPEALHVIFVDTRVQTVIETTPDDFEADMGEYLKNPPHGGGTDLRAGFSWIEDNLHDVECVVCLTDMETPWPDDFMYSERTLFVDTDNRYDAPFGRRVPYESN